MDSKGRPLVAGGLAMASVADWDRDGKLDLLIVNKNVHFIKGNGDMTFDLQDTLKAEGEEITLHDGSAYVTDWDGDGVNDLLVSSGRGEVRLYRGKDEGSGPVALRAPEMLIGPGPEGRRTLKDNDTLELDVECPGYRPRMFMVDWNMDGKLDIVLGDRLSAETIVKLTPEQTKRREELIARNQKLIAEISKMDEDLSKSLKFVLRADTTRAEIEAYHQAVRVLHASEEYAARSKEVLRNNEELQPMSGKFRTFGFVWVYLRK